MDMMELSIPRIKHELGHLEELSATFPDLKVQIEYTGYEYNLYYASDLIRTREDLFFTIGAKEGGSMIVANPYILLDSCDTCTKVYNTSLFVINYSTDIELFVQRKSKCEFENYYQQMVEDKFSPQAIRTLDYELSRYLKTKSQMTYYHMPERVKKFLLFT